MFMTKIDNNDNLNKSNEDKLKNKLNTKIINKDIGNDNDKNDEKKVNIYFPNNLKKKGNTLYHFKNNSSKNINSKLKRNFNKKKEIQNLIKEPEVPSGYRINYLKSIEDKKTRNKNESNLESPINKNYNFISSKNDGKKKSNILMTLQEFLIKEKSVNRFNHNNGLFITDNHKEINIYPKNNNLKNKENIKLFLKDSNPKSKEEKKLTKKNSSININHYNNTNLLKNYYNNKLLFRNKSKNKSLDNINSLNFRKNTIKKNIIDNKNIYIQQENNNKFYFSSSVKKNNNTNNNNDIYNVFNLGEIKPKKLLFDIKHKILPKLTQRK